ncbi:MAG TPA: hypothetical protein VHX38_33350 [Pseudonocardiaceae bacterium]|nr:hypothetical protein [Pseudonocardiaceae bacterium]
MAYLSGSPHSWHLLSISRSSDTLLGTRHLALHGATPEQLRPARRLLIFASTATVALNIANPLVTAAYGKAAFDAVGPLLGPDRLQAINTISSPSKKTVRATASAAGANLDGPTTNTVTTEQCEGPASNSADGPPVIASDGDLINRARREDAHHWVTHQRPISAETLPKNLRISAARSRKLVSIIRAERMAMVAAGQSLAEGPGGVMLPGLWRPVVHSTIKVANALVARSYCSAVIGTTSNCSITLSRRHRWARESSLVPQIMTSRHSIDRH